MATTPMPMRTARAIALSLSWCFAVIAASVGLNSLIKSNQSQSHLKKLATPPTVVSIDVHDIFDVGVLATTSSTLISILTFNYLLPLLLPITSSSPFISRLQTLSTKTLRIQAYSLFFCCIVLLGAMIPFMLFFATREAVVRAFVGTLELPKEVVQKVSAASGSTPVYSKIDYIRLVAIFPWFSLFFTFIAAVVLFKADKVARAAAVLNANLETSDEKARSEASDEKETESRLEKVDV
ncbi:uncharacterized protein LACBIDRAFT_293728 [Laccaria bicolor S238N-H82]|uniref:Predicted protein n=1 Tax=Laccaria bicolor (strain S238N-H82 / ATCC MYA-4686) TaxID=486041 RepID=B0D5Y5_LACBS|nr:uncharacterized protein LACBIDRAFT_293728 [Laccaria bicolor S238N-H82]EDR10105.1 predicted protein [Laccaria bicolor S238N-H82]|eukprot:XP_001879490.1 predicted protein [Laccaria bicolor S238N-H82]